MTVLHRLVAEHCQLPRRGYSVANLPAVELSLGEFADIVPDFLCVNVVLLAAVAILCPRRLLVRFLVFLEPRYEVVPNGGSLGLLQVLVPQRELDA